MISFRPLTSRMAARALGRTLAASAEKTVQLDGGKSWSVPLPIMLPDEPDRIIGHHADSSPERNVALLTKRTIRQGPTRMYLLRDALIADGTILTRTAYDRIADGKTRPVLTGRPEQITEAALCSTQVTQRYFGHWLKDGLTHELLAGDQDVTALVLDRKPWAHEAGYREITGLQAQRTNYARVDRLWLLEDHEINQHFATRFRRLRSLVRGKASKSGAALYLSRGKGGVGRAFVNEGEVQDELSKRGFVILEPEQMAVRDIVAALATADLVVSPEGSSNNHALVAMPEGSALLTIVGAQHLNLFPKLICDTSDIRFGLTIADAVDADAYNQPIDRLMRSIDLISNSSWRREASC